MSHLHLRFRLAALLGTMTLLAILGVVTILTVAPPFQTFRQATVVLHGTTFRVDIADTPSARSLGLGGRQDLEDKGGMLFLFPTLLVPTFWMKDMGFAIDIIWIRGTTIVGYVSNVEPPATGTPDQLLQRFRPAEPVDRVLEIKGGLTAMLGLRAGQSIQVLLP